MAKHCPLLYACPKGTMKMRGQARSGWILDRAHQMALGLKERVNERVVLLTTLSPSYKPGHDGLEEVRRFVTITNIFVTQL